MAPHIFGDATLLLAPLYGYVELYKSKGYDVKLLCRPAVLKFLTSVAQLPVGLEVDSIDFTKLVNSFTYFRQTSKKYRNRCDIAIAPGTSMSNELLIATFKTSKRYAFSSGKRNVSSFIPFIIQKLAYTDLIFPPQDMMQIQRHRMLLHHLGLKSYRGHIFHFQKLNPIIKGDYCVLCPGSSQSFKCWPLDRFTELADWIIETYNIDIHLCGGGMQEEMMANTLIENSKFKHRIISHINKTTFAEWSSIIQHSLFVFGNDSATIHIAAATCRPSICVAGAYDLNQFLPYAVDEIREGDVLPITLLKDIPCRNCRTKYYNPGVGNPSCLQHIKKGACADCISSISVSEAKAAVTELLNNNV